MCLSILSIFFVWSPNEWLLACSIQIFIIKTLKALFMSWKATLYRLKWRHSTSLQDMTHMIFPERRTICHYYFFRFLIPTHIQLWIYLARQLLQFNTMKKLNMSIIQKVQYEYRPSFYYLDTFRYKYKVVYLRICNLWNMIEHWYSQRRNRSSTKQYTELFVLSALLEAICSRHFFIILTQNMLVDKSEFFKILLKGKQNQSMQCNIL